MLADGYLGAAKALRRAGCDVSFSPMMCYSNQNKTTHLTRIKNDIHRENPNVVIWWRSETLSAEDLLEVREAVTRECLFVLYSWDAMHLWEEPMEKDAQEKKCKILDLAFTCCKTSVELYKANGCEAIYAPPGFDPAVHFPEEAPEFACDISLVCTNLYHGNGWTKFPHLSRRDLMSIIIKAFPKKDIRIYGTKDLSDVFPQHYCGLVSFGDTHKVFYNSKINICTHLRPDAEMYYSERVAQVLGSGGLAFIDPVKGLDKVLDTGKECVVMATNTVALIAQIATMLSNYEPMKEIKKRGYERAMKEMTWDNWAKIVLDGIQSRMDTP